MVKQSNEWMEQRANIVNPQDRFAEKNVQTSRNIDGIRLKNRFFKQSAFEEDFIFIDDKITLFHKLT